MLNPEPLVTVEQVEHFFSSSYGVPDICGSCGYYSEEYDTYGTGDSPTTYSCEYSDGDIIAPCCEDQIIEEMEDE